MKITTRMHRGKLCHYWRQNGQPRYRQIKDEKKTDEERADVLVDLRHPTVKHKRKPLLRHLDDFIDGLERKDTKLVRQRIEAVIEAGGFRTFDDFEPEKVRKAVATLFR